DAQSVNIMIAIALAVGSIFFVVFGWLSDKIGRKPIIMAGLALGIVCTFPLFKALTSAANPALATAQQNTRATVTAAPGDCRFQFNPVGTAKFTTSCDIATSFLTKNSVPYDVVTTAAPGTAATVKIGNETVESYDAVAAGDQAKAKEGIFQKAVNMALKDGGYPLKRAAIKV
ncbi:MAG: MHS family MFS transporter, partial [Mesorhizobium sp.]